MELSQKEIDKYRLQMRKLSNSAQYAKAYALAKTLMQKHPKVLTFAYYEAVMTAEDDINFSPKQVQLRYKLATKKFRRLLLRTRGVDPYLRHGFKNEYYWFSKQPYKQYLLGVQAQKQKLLRSGFYSQGVGAAQMAKNYGLAEKKQLALRWAKKSERAWLKYFKVEPNWYNSYFFYAMSLAYQDKLKECDQAFAKAAKIAKKPKNWLAIRKEKTAIMKVHAAMYGETNV